MRKVNKKPAPDVGLAVNPVEINPTISVREQRNIARMQRLRDAIAQGDPRPSLLVELLRREKEGR